MRRNLLFALFIIMMLLSVQEATPVTGAADDIQAQLSPPGYGIRVDLLAHDPALIMNGVNAMALQWVVQDVRWADIEAQPGQYQWAALDAAIDAIRPSGVSALLSVSAAPGWAREPGADLTYDGPPADPIHFATFMFQLATRYKDTVPAYELWPEANTQSAWHSPNGLSPQRYSELLQIGYRAVKAANPLAIVVSGGLAPVAQGDGVQHINDLDFLAQMYVAGAGGGFDVLGVHVNGYNNPAQDLPGQLSGLPGIYSGHSAYFFRHYEQVRQTMLAYDDAETAIWLTGAGWASSDTLLVEAPWATQVSEAQQADYLVAAFAQVATQPYVDVLIVDNFNLAVTPGSTLATGARSLIRDDWSARPAFIALAKLQQHTRLAKRSPT